MPTANQSTIIPLWPDSALGPEKIPLFRRMLFRCFSWLPAMTLWLWGQACPSTPRGDGCQVGVGPCHYLLHAIDLLRPLLDQRLAIASPCATRGSAEAGELWPFSSRGGGTDALPLRAHPWRKGDALLCWTHLGQLVGRALSTDSKDDLVPPILPLCSLIFIPFSVRRDVLLDGGTPLFCID